MEVYEIEVTGRRSLTLPWEEVQVMPIGDVQLGSSGVDVARLRRQFEWARGQEEAGAPPVWFIGMGDYIDLLSPSNRSAWRSVRLYDAAQEAMQRQAEELVEQFLELAAGTAGRWLGILHGHHYFQFEDGTTSDTRIAQRLRAPYLGSCAFVRLKFRATTPSGKRGRSLNCTLWAHHGTGSGIMPHAPLNKLYHVMNSFEADVYLIGHQTKKPVVKMPRIYMTDRPPYRLKAHTKVLCGTGGFTRGYEQGSVDLSGLPAGSYVEKGMMSPVALGSPLLKIRPVFGGSKDGRFDRLDINVEV